MAWWIWILAGLYVTGFGVVLHFHVTELQMVTFPLAVFRSLLWPIWLATGWPHGVPLRMD